MLRVVSAVELSQGHLWNQDEWFVTLLNQLNEGTGYGRSRNKDLNELEIFMAKAILNGLRYWQDPIEVTPTDEAGEGSEGSEQSPGEPTPIARPAIPREAMQPQGASSSRVEAGRPPALDRRSHRMLEKRILETVQVSEWNVMLEMLKINKVIDRYLERKVIIQQGVHKEMKE